MPLRSSLRRCASMIRKKIRLALFDADNSLIEVVGVPYRLFPRGGHDVERWLADMDATEVDMHVLSADTVAKVVDQKIPAPQARFSCKGCGRHMILGGAQIPGECRME